MLPLLLGFWEAFGLVVLILVFFGLYNKLSSGFINSPFLALIVTGFLVWRAHVQRQRAAAYQDLESEQRAALARKGS